jgi:ABC-type multidrug transport system ATPase subunit
MEMLKIEHLTKTYGDKRAVDDLTLGIAPGEICGFIGRNGAGKTTTIKSVCGEGSCRRTDAARAYRRRDQSPVSEA